jgi:hypothetical protein
MFGIVISLLTALWAGRSARVSFSRGHRHPLLRTSVTTCGLAAFGGFIDVVSGTWRALGVLAIHSDMGAFVMYLLGYVIVSLYLMLSVYYGRVVPITLRAAR